VAQQDIQMRPPTNATPVRPSTTHAYVARENPRAQHHKLFSAQQHVEPHQPQEPPPLQYSSLLPHRPASALVKKVGTLRLDKCGVLLIEVHIVVCTAFILAQAHARTYTCTHISAHSCTFLHFPAHICRRNPLCLFRSKP
jgi:hypothetical protein